MCVLLPQRRGYRRIFYCFATHFFYDTLIMA
jgi:hypothetical protein